MTNTNTLSLYELESVTGGLGTEEKTCFQVRGMDKSGHLLVAYFDSYFDAVKFCRRAGISESCIKVVPSPFC